MDLRQRGLRAVPDEVYAFADTLEVLDLSGNMLDTLPADLPRLHRLKVLFCSDNRFTELPEVLGRCPALEMVGFKANQIERVADAALPARLRWLILTDNRLTALPGSIGRCVRLQKLMLAGNRLSRLPASLAACERLELLRIAANAFDAIDAALPPWLLALPRLAWLAYAGNPFCDPWESMAAQAAEPVAWADLRLGAVLGEGASGVIHAAQRAGGEAPPQEVAVKLFKGAITSDGLPRSEMAACLAAGGHPNLVPVRGRISGHPQQREGLVLGRIPAQYRNLAGPPSLASCTRDVYADDLRFAPDDAARLGQGVSSALAQLHARGVLHGDLYAHNILVASDGSPLLGDFGAASFLPPDDAARREALQRLDDRALGWLLAEVAQHTRP
jgi:Protein tyrosine and serine/threonine kinase/Leucine rich repeat/Leucine Rich repeats (2 copies)